MTLSLRLTTRQQQVLRATVRHYIATAEPVGSQALVREYNLSASPATIRNAMGVLERSGLLYQPHTSAGRIPSDSGYRLYVDQLLDAPSNEVLTQVEKLLGDRLGRSDWSLDATLRGAAQLLATVSGCIALITTPQIYTRQLRHLQLVPVSPQQVMLIFVTDGYETHSALMALPQSADGSELDPDLIERELQILSNFLNHELRGRAIAEIAQLEWSDLDREFQHYAQFLQAVVSELNRRSQTSTSSMHILVSGLSEVLLQPEFSEVQQIQTIVHLLEDEQEQLLPLIFDRLDRGHRVSVRIGAENPLEPIQTCTLVSSTYGKGAMPIGSVGVLGPTRMVYENVIALVEAAAEYLSDAVS